MKTILAIVLIIATLPACSHLTPAQKQAAEKIGFGAINLAQHASDVFLRLVISRAASGPRASEDANWLDSIAGGLRSIETTSGGIVTSEFVGETIRQFTDPSKIQWVEVAQDLEAGFFASNDSANLNLEAMAVQANAAAAALRATQ